MKNSLVWLLIVFSHFGHKSWFLYSFLLVGIAASISGYSVAAWIVWTLFVLMVGARITVNKLERFAWFR